MGFKRTWVLIPPLDSYALGYLILFFFIQIEKLSGGVLSGRDALPVGTSNRAARWRTVRLLRRGMRDCLYWSIVCLVGNSGNMGTKWLWEP